MRVSRILAAIALLGVVASAQVMTLQTTLQGGNGQKGNMFDINNISGNAISILSFDQNFLAAGTSKIHIYTKTGSYAGSENIAANWTLVGSATGIVHGGPGTAVNIPIAVNTTINAGTTQAFYVTITTATATNVAYTNGNLVVPATTAGAVAFSDANIQFVCGTGNVYPFGTIFGGPTPGGVGRCWNGIINYQIGGTVTPEYQVNQTNCALDFDGVIGNAFTPAAINRCVGALVTATSATTAGLPYDIGLDFAAPIPASAGAIVLPDGQMFNLNLATAVWLFGGTFGNFVPSVGTFQVPFPAFPATLSAQSVSLDFTAPLLVSLSQAASVTGSTGPTTLAGPNADDSSTTFSLSGTYPGCNLVPVPFFGTMQSQIHVISNGRLMFGATANIDYSPTVAEALADNPSFGLWADFNFVAGSSISVDASTPGVFHANYTNVIYWGTTVTNTFALHVDISGSVMIDGLAGVAVGPTPAPAGTVVDMFAGICAGNMGATDPGATAFTISGPNPGPAGLGAIYAFGPWGSLTTGLTTIAFTPNLGGNYDWIGL